MSISELSARSREVFRELVDAYLETGEPVGSRTLSRRMSLALSPATIRNVMADLEDTGLLFAPPGGKIKFKLRGKARSCPRGRKLIPTAANRLIQKTNATNHLRNRHGRYRQPPQTRALTRAPFSRPLTRRRHRPKPPPKSWTGPYPCAAPRRARLWLPRAQIGRCGAEMLLDRIQGRSTERRIVDLRFEIIQRGSS